MYDDHLNHCIECDAKLPWDVFNYSIQNFNHPLCIYHLDEIRFSGSTPEAVHLYLALKVRGVPAILEKFDGNETIDIAIPDAKVNIEVDGMQHNFSHKQALSDLQRTYFSFLKGYITFRIPNVLVHRYLEETADYITEILNENNNRKWN